MKNNKVSFNATFSGFGIKKDVYDSPDQLMYEKVSKKDISPFCINLSLMGDAEIYSADFVVDKIIPNQQDVKKIETLVRIIFTNVPTQQIGYISYIPPDEYSKISYEPPEDNATAGCFVDIFEDINKFDYYNSLFAQNYTIAISGIGYIDIDSKEKSGTVDFFNLYRIRSPQTEDNIKQTENDIKNNTGIKICQLLESIKNIVLFSSLMLLFLILKILF